MPVGGKSRFLSPTQRHYTCCSNLWSAVWSAAVVWLASGVIMQSVSTRTAVRILVYWFRVIVVASAGVVVITVVVIVVVVVAAVAPAAFVIVAVVDSAGAVVLFSPNSGSASRFHVPDSIRRSTVSSRAFSVLCPFTWNGLPPFLAYRNPLSAPLNQTSRLFFSFFFGPKL